MHGGRCWYIMYCICISITCTVAAVGILCIVYVSLSHARWQVLVCYALYVYLYHMRGDRCWYIMYCICTSITCTVAGVGILCIVFISLSHARWQVWVYYVLYMYLYHMHGGRCTCHRACDRDTYTIHNIRTPATVHVIEIHIQYII
jgi:hypothetical protein